MALAAGGTAVADQPYVTLTSASSGLNLDVKGVSTAPGAPVIQWYPNGQANQYWSVPAVGAIGVIRNENSGMCLTTDGNEGDQLYQKPCLARLANYQNFEVFTDQYGGVGLYNLGYGLDVDVYGGSHSAGQPIDGWPYNGASNQSFIEDYTPGP